MTHTNTRATDRPTSRDASHLKIFLGGCSQRLTLKDFTTMSWIRDKLVPYSSHSWGHTYTTLNIH